MKQLAHLISEINRVSELTRQSHSPNTRKVEQDRVAALSIEAEECLHGLVLKSIQKIQKSKAPAKK